MKKIILFISLFLITASSIRAQKALDFHGQKITDSRIYIILNGTEVECFTHSTTQDGKFKIKNNEKFSLMNGNNCNIYMDWLNPLKYQIVWKDSTSIDDRDKVVKDFVYLLASQFGTTLTSLAKSKNIEELKRSAQTPKSKGTPLLGLDKGFNSLDLTSLFIQLNLSIKDLTEDERKKINELIPFLVMLDEANNKNIPNELDNLFIELFNETDPIEAKSKVEKYKTINKNYELYFKNDIETNLELIGNKLAELKISNQLLNSLVNLSVNKFINEVRSNLTKNKALVNKLNPVITLVNNSLQDKSINLLTANYYKIKDISFNDGEKLETSVRISQFKYDDENKDFIKEKDIVSKKMLFEKYDFFAITVSTGLFYTSSTLKGYGVSNNGNGQFNIVEDNITKNGVAPALFLNFNFGVNSRYFSPLIQLGIDPTKKRPLMLAGGGFSIPSARIAFSAGPIWTWNQSLNKLSVGKTIDSTTDLEKDIKYKFEIEPKGWYLGIQYNF
ncbi:hypothetical protein ACUN24_21415 [Pedobacter sp. WC2501]|uniref:hypothetical protein n=1 Tax=Pedobacter sp. WC2501 TaxID=3461400 RepID=UPI0040453622